MKTDKKALAREMYPKELDKNPIYKHSVQQASTPPALGQLVTEITDALDGLTDNEMDDLGALTHASKVLILALQNELKIAMGMVEILTRKVGSAESTYAETCDCGECGACRQAKGFRVAVKNAKRSIARLSMTQPA